MMAIVNFGGALQIAQNFTSDAERLKAVVSGTKLSSVAPNGDPSVPQLSHAAADFGARDMILALRSLAKNLNPISGRKALILFTSGFPLTEEQLSEVTATIDVCNRSNVAIYPIDVRGLAGGARRQAPGGIGRTSFRRVASAWRLRTVGRIDGFLSKRRAARARRRWTPERRSARTGAGRRKAARASARRGTASRSGPHSDPRPEAG